VKLPDNEPVTKNALRFKWWTLYNIEWLNPAECRDVGITLGDLRDAIIEKFNISDSESLEGAAIIFDGRCHWNKNKTKRIINIYDSERIFISLAD
jgi:5'(3')-deoxyribonucleotidase